MSARGTALLLGVLAVLTGYLWLAEVRPRGGAARTPTPGEGMPLLAVPATLVERVDLEEPGHRLTAVRRDGAWLDARGRPWRDDAVSDLVAVLGTLRPLMIVDHDPPEPADYGLGAAAPRLQLAAADGQPLLALEIGEHNPAWTALYARLTGQPDVVLVGALLGWELEKVRATAPTP